MSWIENLLIIVGISLDIFAAMECQGSLVAKVNKKHLSLVCLIVAVIQLIALSIGYALSNYLLKQQNVADDFAVGEIVAIVIFLGLGIRLLVKAIRNERIQERLEKSLGYRRFIHMAGITSLYTILAGIAFAFFGTEMLSMLIMIVCFTVLCIIAGMYFGYHFGFEGKRKAYIIGTVLLWGAGIDLIVRMILQYR